jgi:hypothetical protein
VQFANITANSETGMVFYGIEEGLIHELSLENIDLTIRDGQHSATFGGNFDLRPVADMEYAVFEHDIPGIYANNISGLSVEGFSLGWGKDLEPFFTSAISLHQSGDILIDGFTGKQAPAGNAPAIELNEISNITIRNCKAKAGTGTFLHHWGLKQPGIFSNNELKNAGKTIVPGDHGFLMEGNLVEE